MGLALWAVLRLPKERKETPWIAGQDLGFALLHADCGLGDGLIEVLPRAVGHADVARKRWDLRRWLGRMSVPR